MVESVSFILASGSPRRREILSRLGLKFEVHVPNVAEHYRPGESPERYALRVAQDKVRAVSKELNDRKPRPWILGADTVVVLDGKNPLGKPKDDEQARQMLSLLSGREHLVMTAWVLYRDEPQAELSDVEVTKVCFKQLRPQEREAYIAIGEGRDKAGAYAIQGLGCFLVEKIEGNYENVVGLPATPIVEALQLLGVVTSFPIVELNGSLS